MTEIINFTIFLFTGIEFRYEISPAMARSQQARLHPDEQSGAAGGRGQRGCGGGDDDDCVIDEGDVVVM